MVNAMITIDEFHQSELRVAKVLSAERVEGSEKLLKLQLDAGDTDALGAPIPRQVISGIAKAYTPEEIIGKKVVIIANLAPRTIMGMESQGMILAASEESGLPVLLIPEKEVAPGSRIS